MEVNMNPEQKAANYFPHQGKKSMKILYSGKSRVSVKIFIELLTDVNSDLLCRNYELHGSSILYLSYDDLGMWTVQQTGDEEHQKSQKTTRRQKKNFFTTIIDQQQEEQSVENIFTRENTYHKMEITGIRINRTKHDTWAVLEPFEFWINILRTDETKINVIRKMEFGEGSSVERVTAWARSINKQGLKTPAVMMQARNPPSGDVYLASMYRLNK